MLDALGLLDGLSLHLNIDRGVAVGCGDTSVASRWLIVNTSTPARNKCTAVLCLMLWGCRCLPASVGLAA